MVRTKNRYIVTKICFIDKPETSIKDVNPHKLRELIKSKVEKYYGQFGVAAMIRLNVKYINDKTKIAIIQVSHGPHRFVTSILPLITYTENENVRYRVLYIGATICKCQAFIAKYQQRYINSMISNYKTDVQKEKFIAEVTKMLDTD